MTNTYRQFFLDHHINAILQARTALRKTSCPVEQARLCQIIDLNSAAINRLDREAVEADRREVA